MQPVRGAVGDIGGELAVEQKLVRPDGQHDHLTRCHVVARCHGRLRMLLQRDRLGVDVFERLEESLHPLAHCLHRLGLHDGQLTAQQDQMVSALLTQLRPDGLFFIGTAEGRVPCDTPLKVLAPGAFRKVAG